MIVDINVDMVGRSQGAVQGIAETKTGVSLDLNIFYYCGVGDRFTLGAVAGANPTDCLQ